MRLCRSNTASVSDRISCINAAISSPRDLDAMICLWSSVFNSVSRFNSSSRRRASSLYLRSSSESGLNSDVDSGSVDVSHVMAVGLLLSVTKNREREEERELIG